MKIADVQVVYHSACDAGGGHWRVVYRANGWGESEEFLTREQAERRAVELREQAD